MSVEKALEKAGPEALDAAATVRVNFDVSSEDERERMKRTAEAYGHATLAGYFRRLHEVAERMLQKRRKR